MVATMQWTTSVTLSACYYYEEICYFNALISKTVCGRVSQTQGIILCLINTSYKP